MVVAKQEINICGKIKYYGEVCGAYFSPDVKFAAIIRFNGGGDSILA